MKRMIMTMIATVMMITSVSANHVPTFGNQRDNTPVALPVTQNTRPVDNGMPQQNNDKKDCKNCNKQNNKNCKDCKKSDSNSKKNKKNSKNCSCKNCNKTSCKSCNCKQNSKNCKKSCCDKQDNNKDYKKENKSFGNMKR